MKTLSVAAAVICDREDRPSRIFAAERGYGAQKGGWEFPGGKLEPGETPAEALRREIREELDTEIHVGKHLGTVEYAYPAFHLRMDCFLCSVIAGTLTLKEATDSRWLTAQTLDSVSWLPADLKILDAVRRILE